MTTHAGYFPEIKPLARTRAARVPRVEMTARFQDGTRSSRIVLVASKFREDRRDRRAAPRRDGSCF